MISAARDQSEAYTLPAFSIVVPTVHRAAALDDCLRAIAALNYPNYATIVVDNSTGEPETRAVAESWNATYAIEPRRGLARARNTGARLAQGEIIAYLDDDALPERDWLGAYAAAFQDPLIMAAAGRTLPTKLNTPAEQLALGLRGSAYDRPEGFVVDRSTPDWFGIAGFGGIGPGCNMALRRSAFDVWDGFHVRTGRGTPVHGGEEQHAFLTLVALGHRAAYVPAAVVRHPLPATLPELVEEYLQNRTASSAFMTLLLLEEPRHLGRTLKYIAEGVLGKRRAWRPPAERGPRIASRFRTALALLRGPYCYLRGLLPDSDTGPE